MKKYIALLAFIIVSLSLQAQTIPTKVAKVRKAHQFSIGMVDQLVSTQLGETRILNIYLPDGYSADTTKKYPVIYLLDGSANEDFLHIAGLVQFLTMINKMPATIVVGIANIDRKRDFTFPTTVKKDKDETPTSGGSAKFIAFLEKDLQPYIEGKYRVTDDKTLIGQSLGGLLATEVLFTKPAMFNKYVIVSPSLWWDNESLLKTKINWPKTPTNVQIMVGDEWDIMEKEAKELSDMLAGKDNLAVTYTFMPEENHLTILHNAAYKALENLNKK